VCTGTFGTEDPRAADCCGPYPAVAEDLVDPTAGESSAGDPVGGVVVAAEEGVAA
jgi:hypothetical protein